MTYPTHHRLLTSDNLVTFELIFSMLGALGMVMLMIHEGAGKALIVAGIGGLIMIYALLTAERISRRRETVMDKVMVVSNIALLAGLLGSVLVFFKCPGHWWIMGISLGILLVAATYGMLTAWVRRTLREEIRWIVLRLMLLSAVLVLMGLLP